jgi:hypothetical protein
MAVHTVQGVLHSECTPVLCGTVLEATALTIFARSYGACSSSDADTHTEPPIWRRIRFITARGKAIPIWQVCVNPRIKGAGPDADHPVRL